MKQIKVVLKSGKDEPLRRFHPWVFSGAVSRTVGDPDDGDLAVVEDHKGRLLGVGHFHHGSIAVRMLSFAEADLAAPAFWEDKLRSAWQLRRQIGLADSEATDCFRLVHGEGDGLSGLVVDVYGPTAVVQCHSIGMHRQRDLIAGALRTVLRDRLLAVYDKSAEALPSHYAATVQNGYLWQEMAEPDLRFLVKEQGIRFRVDLAEGQKTGFFLDQRDNRRLLGEYASGKSVLNTFCYTGGFSAYALAAGASLVHSVDISAKAMVLAEENAALNHPGGSEHQGFTADVMRFLLQSDDLYDIVVVDPPAFAKSNEKRHNAVQGYKRLNAAAMKKVKPGGLMFTFSCSQVVGRDLFYNTVVAAALEGGRQVRVLHHLSQGGDHPVSLFHPEGAYLKGLVLFVD